MPQVILSNRAQADIFRLHQFLHTQDPASAKRAVWAIREAFAPLSDYPFLGRAIEEHDEWRELVIEFGNSGYLALYQYDVAADVLVILAVKHQREDDYQ